MNGVDPTAFDLAGPLPRGTVVLEASAGTGKTYAIAALATRYVAEAGIGLGELLLVTFTRAAAAELRERVRARLVQAANHLEARLAGTEGLTGDEVLDHLANGSRTELARRHQRLVVANTELETATITTIHGFCQQVLRSIGFAAAVPQQAILLEDEQELLEQVLSDRMVARFVARPGAPRWKAVLAAATAAANDPDALLLPTEPPTDDDVAGDDPDATARLVAQLAREVRDELARRKRAAGVLSHHDLLTRLRSAIRDPVSGPAAIDTLRERYRVALIDEFQDTDPVQWEILDRTFRAPGTGAAGSDRDRRALVLIGDPKQAIYAFRGADVRAYLHATTNADQRHTLSTSWRCDGPLVVALNRLFAGTVYGEAGITQRDLQIAPNRTNSRLGGAASLVAPLTVRVVTAVGDDRAAPTADVRQSLIPADVAVQIAAMLEPGALTVDGRRCEPGDIAVLVRANADASTLQRTLRRARIPAVINGVGSVLATSSARDWSMLLEALEQPSSSRGARRLAVTDFVGWTGEELASADDQDWDRFHERLHAWAGVLREHGVAALFRRVAVDGDLAPRVLRYVGGERRLTDLRHVARLLHDAEIDGGRGATALTSWLKERIATTNADDIPPDEQARRLESDAHAVQILTVHRSKGLEFPIVLCPYLWGQGRSPQPPLTFHPKDREGRAIDVGPAARDGYHDASQRSQEAQRGEDLRLLYVAMTRARHRVVVWWVAPDRHARSALGQLLFSRENGQVRSDLDPRYPGRDEVVDNLGELVESCGGRLEVVPPTVALPQAPVSEAAPPSMAAANLRRAIDHSWRRTSYSGIVGDHPPGHTGLFDDPGTDETIEHHAPRDAITRADHADDGRDLRRVQLPLANVRGSAHLGTMLHDVLEHLDFAAADLRGALNRELTTQQTRYGIASDRDALFDGLYAALRTPMGSVAGNQMLVDIGRADRLDEPRFELPLAGGDQNAGEGAALDGIADLLVQHLPPDDPLVDYHRRLRDRRFSTNLRGYLNGAIDLVFRMRGGRDADVDHDRFVVVDYKSNRLGWPDTPTAWDYQPQALTTAMQDAHYPLQALLYSVALHRLLRWRMKDYAPDRHLGGVAYLFLRGMVGPDNPTVDGQPCGVFSWRPPTALVTDLSALLDGRKGRL